MAELLKRKFPHGPQAWDHYGELLVNYSQSGLAPPHMLPELRTGEDGKFWSYLWEAMLFHHFHSLGFEFKHGLVRKDGQQGPDFGLVHEGRTIWIEAVVPAPEGVDPEFLRPPERGEVRARSTPHDAVLLRWLSAISAKERQMAKHIQSGLIREADCTVIAVNGNRLADWWIDDTGISQLPMIVEAVFPIGGLAIPISPEGTLDGDPIRLERFSVQKANSSSVPTTTFLHAQFGHVSAALGCVQKDFFDKSPQLSLVHNPMATSPLPRKLLGASKEYLAEEKDSDTYELRRLD